MEAAIIEAKYALDVLGADGIKLATNAYGQYLGDEELEPLMAYLNSRKAVIITHPHKPSAVNDRLIAAVPLAQDAQAFVQTVDFSVWPKGEPNTAYAQYFTGNSYLAPMDGGVANVTFEPGCRNHWHIHHRQVQVLICVAGRGWYQEWGKPAVPLVPGTIIEIPEGAKHWHGAAADSWMQHLTFHKDVQDGASNEWLEPVSEEQL